MPYLDARLSGWDEVLAWMTEYQAGWREKMLRMKTEREEKVKVRAKAEGNSVKAAVQGSTAGGTWKP